MAVGCFQGKAQRARSAEKYLKNRWHRYRKLRYLLDEMRHLKSEHSRRIAVVQSSVNVRRLTPGLAPFAGMGYDFWIIDLYRQPDLLLASLREWKPSAIITEWLPGLTDGLLELGCPVILVPSDEPVAGVFSVDIDDVAIGRLAAGHLIARGYQNFAFVGRGDAHYAKQRLAGFQSVVGEVPVYWEEFRDWRQYDEYWRDPDEDMVGWLTALPTPLGIFTAHDPTGRHVLEAAAQAGMEVPFAVGVISANDDETVCEMARPALSSIRLPWRRLAAEVVQMIERIGSGNPPLSPVLVQPLEIVARGSSSYEAVGDPVVAAGHAVSRGANFYDRFRGRMGQQDRRFAKGVRTAFPHLARPLASRDDPARADRAGEKPAHHYRSSRRDHCRALRLPKQRATDRKFPRSRWCAADDLSPRFTGEILIVKGIGEI